ncbi:MAG: hypothetical protein NC937_02795 [Candidatus Omnitrophica bacterium]|nr:hypothetical protein [Candidatus Omnitrophota bacterium]
MCWCCGSRKEKEKKEYECAVEPKKCTTKTVEKDQEIPMCCGMPMRVKK